MMNYDMTTNGGVVEYTEKFNKHYKNEVIGDIGEMFQVRLFNRSTVMVR